MASGLSSQTPLGMRHRIREINLHPTPSSRPVELEVLIDDKLIYVLPTVESGQPLHWDMRLLPCDVFPNSRVTLRFTKKNRISSDRLSLAEYIVSDVDGQSSVTIDVSTQFSRPPLSLTPHTKLARESDRKDPPSVTLKFWDRREIEGAYIAALTRSKLALDVQQGSLEGLGKASLVLEKVIGLGEALAELNPSAKIVTILFTAAWEHIEEIQRNHQDIQKLVNGLGRIMPFLESVREHSKEARLQGTVTSLLNLIEDVSNFITGYMTHSVVGGKADEQLTSLLQRFKDLKEDFDRGVQAEQLKHIVTNEQRSLLSRLSPAMRAHYSTKPACQQGTRQQVLNDVYEWISQLDTPKKLAWLYGHAGLGKSCISASVCHKLDEERKLGAHFFCKRDDPDLRRCGTVLNTIVHQLATRFGPYGKEVASAIDECPQLPESSLEQRYTRLIERPLRKLNEEQVAPTTHLAIVIDAFDECERSRERRLLLTFLRQMSGLVSWLKVMVTSRLDQDIKAALGRVDDPAVCSRDILVYDASYDIYACTQKRMLEIAEFKAQVDWSEQTIRTLSERSGGLFIWIETACKFIENGSDADSRLEQILDGTQPAEGSEPLDMLFTTAIEQSLGDGARDNVRNARLCLGAILATADRTPLSVIGLEGLMSSQMKRGVFRNVVSGLGSVLYEDKSSGNAVRVYHPSFADFISNRTRSNQFYVEPEEQNIRMAECCLRTMTKELAFNICGLETSHIANRDIPELEARVQTSISEQLRYSCLHWSSHVTAMPKGALKELLGEFILGRTLLYWMEALSLMSKLDVVLSSLLELVEWCSVSRWARAVTPPTSEEQTPITNQGTTQNISSYAHDAYRFVLSFYDAILESTPHLYLSALALAPNGSQIAQHMRAFFPNTLSIGGSLNGGWSTWLRNIPHGAVVTGTEISSDGRRIVSGTKSSLVQLWDADSGAAISDPLVGHTNTVRSVSFSSDGRRVVSSSYDHTARVWDLETGGTVSVLPHTAGVICAIFSPDNLQVITGCFDKKIRIWDANVGNEVREPLEGHSDAVNSLAVTRNGLCIASGSSDHTVRLWELARNSAISEPLAAHTDYVYSVSFSPNDRQLVSGSNDGTIHIWDTVTRTILMKIPDRKFGPVWSARYSPSGRHIIAGTWDKMIRIWDVKTGALLSEPLAGHVGAVRSVVFSPNGRRVISGSEDGTVRVWDAEIEATPPEDGKQGLTSVWAVAFSPDSRKVASSHIDSVIRVWSVETGAVLQKIALEQEGEARSVQFSPDGRFVSYSCNHAVHICDAESGNAVSGPMVSHSDLIWSIAFSPDSKRIVSGSRDETIQVWDVESAVVLLGPLVGHTGGVRCVCYTPDGRRIISGGNDSIIKIWDAESGDLVWEQLVGHSRPITSITIAPDSKQIVSGSQDNTIIVWDVETGTATSKPLMGNCGVVFSVAFSPDGERVVVGPYDNTVQVWDMKTHQRISEPFQGHTDFVKSVAWSPDGQYFASGSNDGTIRIWNADSSAVSNRTAVLRSELPKLPTLLRDLARLADKDGWVRMSSGELLIWLPAEYRIVDDSLLQFSELEVPDRLRVDTLKFEHDVNLRPTPSSRPVEFELLVDDKLIYSLPTVESGQPLHWDMRLLPIDVYANSRVTLKFTKKNRISSDRVSFVEYIVSDIDGQSSITIDVSTQGSRSPLSLTPHTKLARDSDKKEPGAVSLKFWGKKEVEDAYMAGLARAKLTLDAERGPLERLGKAGLILEKVVEFGEGLADLNPSAKIVVGLFTTAWEHIESLERSHQEMRNLVNGLSRMMPFLDAIRQHSRGTQLKGPTTGLLNLIEDVANFITRYMSDTSPGKALRNPLSGKADEQIALLLRKFNELKEDFDRGVQIEQLKHIITNEQRAVLNKLSPATRAHYSNTTPCLEGTREQVLKDVYDWISRLDTTKKLAWLYGHAGLGKSCISSSVCRKFDQEGKLAAHFFCKRDDPELRRPGCVLNTIVHQLATRFAPYGKEVANAIEECPQLPDSSLEQRYTRFIDRPLRNLNKEQISPSTSLAIVIDAFDECERTRDRRLLLTYLREMSGLVSWLKVMITSRIDQDIKLALGRAEDPVVCSRDVLVYDASYDIYACTQKRMLEIAEFKAQVDWSEQTIRMLSERSGGLFIWIETACKFIENGSDADSRLEQILDGTQPAEGSEPLDMLFATAIEQSLGDNAQDNVRNARLCLGAIISTADRTPLSVAGLEGLMSSQMKRGVFRNVVNGLGSVLYEDKTAGNAVRVYHPSFADFLTNKSRSQRFHVEPEEQDTRMAECCLRTMTKELAFNICGLETSHKTNRDIPNLNSRIQNSISEQLKYSCLHWTSHITKIPKGALRELLSEFMLGQTLLYWMEALSVMSKLDVGLSSLLELVEWCSVSRWARAVTPPSVEEQTPKTNQATMMSISSYAHDAYRFLLAFYDAISRSTPHLYLSALALAPNGSQIAARMRPLFPNTLKIGEDLNAEWSPWLRTIPHGAVITSLEVSSDGRRIVSGAKNSLVQLWDADSGALISDPLLGHTDTVRSVSFSPDGRCIVSASYDHTARVWDLETGSPVSVMLHAAGVICAIFSPDSKQVFTGCFDEKIRLWDATMGTEAVEPLVGHSGAVNSLAVTRDGRSLASGSTDRTIRLWDLVYSSAISEPLVGHTDFVYSVAFSPDDHRLVSGSNDGTIRIWDITTRTVILSLLDAKFGPVWSAVYSPSGRHIISGTWDKAIRIWDAKTGVLLTEPLQGHLGAVRSAVFTSNGRRIISGSEDGTVRVWDAEIEVAPEPQTQDPIRVWAVAFSPDSRLVASSHIDSIVRIWDIETQAVLQEIKLEPGDQVWSVQFSPNGRLVSCSCNNAIKIWNTENYTPISNALIAHTDLVWSIGFSPDNQRIASGSQDETILVWDVLNGAVTLGPLVGHSGGVRCVCFTPDCLRIISGGNDSTIKIWDAHSGQLVLNPLVGHSRPVCSITVSPDGRRLVSGAEDNTIIAWDTETGIATSKPLMGKSGVVFSVSFAPDGNRVAVAPYDNTVQIWDIGTYQPASGPFRGHSDFVKSVAWSPNGKYILSGSNDGTIRVWNADSDANISRAAVSTPNSLVHTVAK
ncbi:WD40 repeat protein [Ceratobasidium sp. AG-Ba]|nr:WD40 repeat protein [Ceratobasidium sp. AG-Ba]